MIRTLLAVLALTFAAPAFAHDITFGDLQLNGPFARATLPNAPVAGGFVTIVNTGSEDDRLISATAEIAKDTQIHEMAMEGDVMKMRQLPDGLVIPAGGSVTLEPGGYHLMMMGLSAPLVEGETVPVVLTFEKAGTVTLDLHIGGAAADAPTHGH
ncbi:copper chaperone PCu(A)C [Devosia rhizoryzae]|uniref:Copper chaperone PCu(A)C n=1 Tax=Devosia rhizoryzae TaxID=2774137 RepID=A0ABX7C3Z5_9HYPH|nr:copper chaperone PCu(A)C [Devosia rhizoryzae]QQR38811.1 copper chaperone PCu(A)C [Devosia rhizoryzae]